MIPEKPTFNRFRAWSGGFSTGSLGNEGKVRCEYFG
jgi:hypothetical protein